MNLFHVLGIIVIAVGTFLMVYGSHIKSKQDRGDFEEKHFEVIASIDSLKAKEDSTNDIGATEKIEKQYLEWADQFFGGIEKTKLTVEKEKIKEVEIQLDLSNEYRYLYEVFFSTLSSHISAYNEKSGNRIKYNYRELPSNIFHVNWNDPICVIKFSTENVLVIELKADLLNVSRNEIPLLCINHTTQPEYDKRMKGEHLYFHKELANIEFRSEGVERIVKNTITFWNANEPSLEYYPLIEYESVFKEIVDLLLKPQILSAFH